jgi:type IV pilus assembly protein PilE
MNNKYKSTGFTLMELLIALAIVGLLSAIAYPNYRQYLLRAHRAEGLTAMQQAALRQERYYSNNSTYAPNMVTLGMPADTQNGYYTISIAPCDTGPNAGNIDRCFELTANAQGAQADDTDCATLTLDSAGQETPADCWD